MGYLPGARSAVSADRESAIVVFVVTVLFLSLV